ncbi:hypothetical protein CROQUDRAFT_579847 [Cronartium quercuum f. sp. fusiforme G11]|uniref:Uncharacterized protein n=1 Tax=Cronartium quercuum f. sp. fusiforme G11 TaxID=708437 RepID=A0A9P6TC81_9BASI|nr:hypothetical protein CROQUDRAFT_579847 [Cronartium quercuum f. sp. fusiforme G11]
MDIDINAIDQSNPTAAVRRICHTCRLCYNCCKPYDDSHIKNGRQVCQKATDSDIIQLLKAATTAISVIDTILPDEDITFETTSAITEQLELYWQSAAPGHS